MAIERITDANYDAFRDNDSAVLVVSATWCHFCEEYKPIVSGISDDIPLVSFGDAVLDEGRLRKLKREFGDLLDHAGLPTTILFKNGQPVGGFEGRMPREFVVDVIGEKLLSEELPSE